MKSMGWIKSGSKILCASAVAAVMLAQPTLSQAAGDTATVGSKEAPTTKPTADVRELQKAYSEAYMAVSKILTADVMKDPAQRDAAAPTAIPAIYHRMDALTAAAKPSKISTGQVDQMMMVNDALLYLLNDAPEKKKVDDLLASSEPEKKFQGQSIQILAKWLGEGKDSAELQKMVDEVSVLDKANPTSDTLTELTINMAGNPHNPETNKQLSALSQKTMTSAYSKEVQERVAAFMKHMQEQQASMKAAAEAMKTKLEGKPMVLAGKTVDGKDFTTADMKGKVILVDFWAVWCGPCVASLPHVKEVYSKYHDKGLEIVGVDNDPKADTVIKFTAKENMPWPQLFAVSTNPRNSFNPMSQEYGVQGIPTMFLIDKQGNCRSVEARANMDDLVPKLLAE